MPKVAAIKSSRASPKKRDSKVKKATIRPDLNNIGSKLPFDACKEIRKNSASAGLEKPELVRSTQLRKHVATQAQLLSLNQHELEQLCSFMGHDFSVHLEYYRLPSDTEELARVSQILMKMENGATIKSLGKRIKDIVLEGNSSRNIKYFF